MGYRKEVADLAERHAVLSPETAPCVSGVPTIHGGRTVSHAAYVAHGCGVWMSTQVATTHIARNGFSSVLRCWLRSSRSKFARLQ
jgi:hypothetical protein